MTTKINLNLDWKFYLGDEPDADYMGFDDSAWRNITLPHDWSVEHPFDKKYASGTGYLPGGTAWYRKSFTLDESAKGQRILVTFGGVYKHSRVWINSNYLGQRAYGYSSFTYDITEFARIGENVISVRAEHEQVADSRWFTGSGIYRDVTLTLADPRSFDENGLFVSTGSVDAGGANVNVEYKALAGESVAFSIENDSGAEVAQVSAAGINGVAVLHVDSPALWSPDSPTLYTLKARVIANGAITDERTVRFGIRTFSFDESKGFFLNGEGMKLKGVCVHHDAGVLGAAVPASVWAQRIMKFKECGCNALRTAHNPPDTKLLDLCDELGLLVMDEAFDEWEGSKNKWWQGHNVYPPKRMGYAEDFPDWHERDLTDMILRDRNHPCIIMWSIGNEIDYPNDPYVHPLFAQVMGNNDANKPAAERQYDMRKPDANRLAVIARELTRIVKKYDVTRPVTSALAFPELSNLTGYAQALDVVGYNYKEHLYADDHAKYTSHVIYGSENGHSVAAWRAVADNDYICGQFLWTGIDFLGEAHGWPIRVSQAGLLTTAGFEKPLYCQRKALWTDEPFVRIAVGHGETWSEKFIWAGNAGEERVVSVYTNQPTVELFLNGMSLGVREAGIANECRAMWNVPYQAGELRAVAGNVEDKLCSANAAKKLVLASDKQTLHADCQDVAQIELTLLDENGNIAAAHDELVTVQVIGDAALLGLENGRPDDLTPYTEHSRLTCGGRLIAYVRSGKLRGAITVLAFTETGVNAQTGIKTI